MADELGPAVDPQGRTLFYVSNQGGNRDVWSRPVGGGTPRRITDHSADDFDPAVAPRGQRIAFCSKRLDAKGDLFLAQKNGEEVQRLTGRTSGDRQPAWFPDGRFLAFTRSVGNRPESIYRLDLSQRSVTRLSKGAGFDPSLSPGGDYLLYTSIEPRAQGSAGPCLRLQRLADGQESDLHLCDRPEGFGSWVSQAGQDWVVFSRFQDDTNGDGVVDVQDRPSLWKQRLLGWSKAGPELDPMIPLTAGTSSDISPVAANEVVFYASRDDEDLDIWSIPLAGALKPVPDFELARRMVVEANTAQDALFILRRCAVEGEGSPSGERCALAVAERLQYMGRWPQAAEAFERLFRMAVNGEVSGRARIGQVAARMAQVLPLAMTSSEQTERAPEADKLLGRLDDAPPAAGRKDLVRADIMRRVGRWSEALLVLDDLIGRASADPLTVARGRLLRADVLEVLGNPDSALDSLLDVLKLHPEQRDEMVTAAGRILSRTLEAGGLLAVDGTPIERLESLARKWPRVPVLPAMVRFEVGQLHRKAQRPELARRAFQEVERRFSAEPEMVTRALLALSDMAEQDDDLSQALDHANELLELFPERPQTRRVAKRRVRRLASTYAEELLAQGETGMAIKVYRQLLQQDPGDVVAHRQWISLMAARGRAAEALKTTARRMELSPGDDLAIYLYGLSLTYVDPPNRFDEALEAIDRSLAINGQSPFAHQTRGWIHEQSFHSQGRREGLQRAAEAYQAALSLLDVRAHPRAEADLLLNLGNVFYSLGNRRRAFHFYSRRQQTEIPFSLPARRLVFLEQYGRSALLSDELDDAVRAFSSAAALSRDLGRSNRLPRLMASQAAACQLQGKHDRAAELFDRACAVFAQQKDFKRQATCQRNVAYNLYMLDDRPAALKAFLKAERLIQRYGSAADSGETVVSVGLGEKASRAASGFDADGELNIIYTLMTRLHGKAGDLVRARSAGQRRMKLLKKVSGSLRTGYLLQEMSITNNHRAATAWKLGLTQEAVRLYRRATQLAAETGSVEGMLVNTLNRLGILLSRKGSVQPEILLAELQDLEVAEADGLALRPLSRVRMLNARGVLHAVMAERTDLSSRGPQAGDEFGLGLALADLDRSLRYLRQAEENFRRARQLALELDSRAASRLAVLAGRNQVQILNQLGQGDEADKLQAQLRRSVDSLGLLSVGWRLSDGPARERALDLLKLPAELAGTDGEQGAIRLRDELLLGLISDALSARKNDEAFLWAERLLLRRRSDGIRVEDLHPTTYEDMQYLQGLRKLRRSFFKSLDSLDGQIAPEQRTAARLSLEQALKGWTDYRERGGKPGSWMRSLFSSKALGPTALTRQLQAEQGLLLAVALPDGLAVFLVSGQGLSVHRQALDPAEFQRQRRQMLSGDAAVSAGARSQLSAWILGPLTAELKKLKSLVVVADDLGLPMGLLIHQGRALVQSMSLTSLCCPGDLAVLGSLRNLNLQRLLWVGPGPDGPKLESTYKKYFGSLDKAPSEPAELSEALDQAGVVLWNAPLVVDEQRPLRSALELDPRGGALTGISFGKLASRDLRSALWILTGESKTSTEKGDQVYSMNQAGLELAMAGAGVPTSLLLPDGLKHKERSAVLEDFCRDLASKSPAEALSAALATALERKVSWRQLVGVQLRGDGGMSIEARRVFAQRKLGATVKQAMLAFRQQRWSEALGRFLLVRQLAVYLKQTALLPRVDEAIMKSAFQQGQYYLAAEAERRLLANALQKDDRPAVARARNLLGVLESKSGNLDLALEQLNLAIAELDNLGLAAEAAESRANLAVVLDSAARYGESLKATSDALKRFQEQGKSKRAVGMLRNLGTTCLKRLNLASTARDWYEQALALAVSTTDRAAEAGICLDLARTDLSVGRYEAALKLASRSEKIYGDSNNLSGRAGALLERAKALWYLGEYQRAFLAQSQALQVAEKARDTRLIIAARSIGGLIDLNLGNLAGAQKALGKALAEARKARLKDEEATQLNNLGIVARERGDLEGALELFQQARRLDAQLKSVLGRAYDLRNMGIVEQMLGRHDQAHKNLNQALKLSRSVQDRFNEVKTLAGLSRLEILRGNLSVATGHARQAYDLATDLGLREVSWRALRSLGTIASREGRLQQAVEHYRSAIELVEQMRAGLKMERFRSGFLDNKYDLYEDMVHLLLQLERPGEAFSYTERSRARGFLDLLSNRQLVLGSAGDQALLDRVRDGKVSLERLQEKVRRAQGSAVAEARAELDKARSEYTRLMEQLREQNPDLTDFVEVRPVDAQQIGARLGPRVALLSYYVTHDDTLAFVVRSDGVYASKLPLSRAALVERIERVRKLLQNFTPADKELHSLYQDLVQPLEESLQGVDSIGILPHDVLNYLSFAALRDSPNRYWSEKVRLFSSPSASVLTLLLRREEERFGPGGALLAVGNPDLGDPSLNLPFSEHEARAVGLEQPGGNVFLGKGASEEQIREYIGKSMFVHLASHGTYDANSPLFSAVKLAPGSQQDGDLTAMEVFSLPIEARLVTLSACQTGLGKLKRGDEIIGLNRSFLAAGAGGVLSSLWRVSDVATAVLMKRFYRNLRHLPPAQALQQAQKVVRTYFPHPAYWAGFVLTGTWR